MGETVEDSNTDTVSMSIDSSGQSNSSNLPHAPTAVSNATTAAPHKPALPNETLTSTTMSSINVDQSGVNKNSISTKNLTSAPGTSDNTTTSITNTRSRRDRPCDACRRRKSRCVLNEGSSICVLCRFHNQDCTFVQSPQPRKRRLAAEPTGGDNKTDRDRNRDKGDRESRHKGKDADGGGGRDIERGSGSKKRFEHIF